MDENKDDDDETVDEDIIPTTNDGSLPDVDDVLSLKVSNIALRYCVMVLFVKKYKGLEVESGIDLKHN